jgi:hypothetical protein
LSSQFLRWHFVAVVNAGSCEGPGSVLCAAACDWIPSWSRWRFAEFGYSTIEVAGAELTMRFFSDVEDYAAKATPNRQMYNFTIRRPRGLVEAAEG